ncbi:hypothetical protein GBAR_LOCUS2097 [Geodia barretti]|uniref:Uncharacterized protein n=1 Tax=Geodia barretti TaxID=519541 RepID=A0AA35VXH5_GEOBA|nr:hypothetical protein GBAR_LOCUS2097 [Geodia barretti]
MYDLYSHYQFLELIMFFDTFYTCSIDAGRFKSSSGRPRSKSGSDMAVCAYLTYITLPWHCIVDDILNSTRKRVL